MIASLWFGMAFSKLLRVPSTMTAISIVTFLRLLPFIAWSNLAFFPLASAVMSPGSWDRPARGPFTGLGQAFGPQRPGMGPRGLSGPAPMRRPSLRERAALGLRPRGNRMARRRAALDQIPPGLRPPDFFVIGQQKSGTSTIWAVLSQHPRVKYGSVKENFYFGKRQCEKPIKNYLEIMNNERLLPSHVLGDFTATNLGCACCAEVLHNLNPHAKILVLLRAPIQRSYSRYLEQSNVNDPKLEFNIPHRSIVLGPKGFPAYSEAAIRTIDLCLSLGQPLLFCLQNDNVIGWSYYTPFLRIWLDKFGPAQVMVLYTEEMDHNLVSVIRLVEGFLGLEPFEYPDLRPDTKFNTRGCYGWGKAQTEQCEKRAEEEAKFSEPALVEEETDHLERFFRPMLGEIDKWAEQGLVRRPPVGWGPYRPPMPKDTSSEL